MLKRLIPQLVCIALLSACVTTDPHGPAVSLKSVADAVSAANMAVKAGQRDRAIEILHGAALAHPSAKEPWVRMAQIMYEAGEYGHAIVRAEQALHRDPDDMLAYSIAAVSGLRVASTAFADLTRKHNLGGTVRSEAQDLAKLLRASLGEDVLVPLGSSPLRSAGSEKKSMYNPRGPAVTSPKSPPRAANNKGPK